MADIQVAILGLGRLGASMGLALKRHTKNGGAHNFIITGYDAVAKNSKTAKDIGAIDQHKGRPAETVRDKNIVVIAMPYGEVEAIYSLIGKSLTRGTVVIDLSALKQNAMQSAQKHMPEGTHLVCGAAIYNAAYLFNSIDHTDKATADLFDKGVMMLMPGVRCAEQAITLANDLSAIIGATPHFFDPAEHDALVSAVEALPSLLGVTLFAMLQGNNGWDDMRRLTNPAFGMVTHFLFDRHPDDLSRLWLDNREELVRHINGFIKSLTTMRDLVQDNDRDSLSALLESKASSYEQWINQRHKQNWDEDKTRVTTPSFGDTMGGAMFGGLFRRKDDDDK
ncbi:MAG: prephenate dehydrogenase [Anaerolineaceae bacterium]|nr:MAG: prephenate dehydrogenase [Anaerolineaceae bacterium]